MHSLGRLSGVLVACCLAAAACGNSDVDLNGVEGDVTPGFFIGETENGGDLSIAAETIRAIFFECGGNDASVVFTPPEPIAGDGSFAVDFSDAGRRFTVTGRFHSQNHVEGRIEGDDDCNGHFEADRCDENRQDCGDSDGDSIPNEVDPDSTAPVRTPTPVPTSASSRTATVTPVTGTSTPTVVATPSAVRTSTPVATATPITLCGNGIIDTLNEEEDIREECDGVLIDTELCGPCTCGEFCDDEGGSLSCNSNCTLNFSQCTAQPCEIF